MCMILCPPLSVVGDIQFKSCPSVWNFVYRIDPDMEWYLGKNYTMPAYCYSLLTDTAIIPTGIIIMHVYTSILFVDNNIMLDGSNNLHAVCKEQLI